MDPLGVVTGLSHSISDIRRWAFTETSSDSFSCDSFENSLVSPFPFDNEINKRVALWAGDVTRLYDVDAIVHVTNEAGSSRDPIAQKILKSGGQDLATEIKNKIRGCKTGEARISEAFGLNSRFVIHVVGPRYHSKYATAAETALYQAYRSLLDIFRSESLASVALTCIHSTRRGYPPLEGAHLALRTVRHFLQRSLKPKSPEDVEAFERHPWSLPGADPLLIFCVNDDELDAYKEAMPLYFPRSRAEEKWAFTKLPSDLGGAFGEPLRPGRQIDIMGRLESDNAADSDNSCNIKNYYVSFCGRLLDEIAAEERAVGRSPFAQMEGDYDKKAIQRLAHVRRPSSATLDDENMDKVRYDKLLERAKRADFSRFSSSRCFYKSGVDREGNAVVVFVGRHLSFTDIDADQAILYLIHVLDPVATRPFNVVYLHTLSSGDTTPPSSFLRRVHYELPSKFGTNLKNFFLVHPSISSRIFMWFFTSFKAPTMKNRFTSVKSLHQLYAFISPEQLDIPPFVLHHDMKLNCEIYQLNPTAVQLPRLTESVATGWTVAQL